MYTSPDTATCNDNTAGFECICKPGYIQHPNTSDFVCMKVNECLDGTNDCDINADCTDTMGSYECNCYDGFAGFTLYIEPYVFSILVGVLFLK